MVCDEQYLTNQSEADRLREIQEAMDKLERLLREKSVTLGISPGGAIVFRGWSDKDRARISDACAFRKLAVQNSWELRQAIATAQAETGRQVNMNAIGSGLHSHDGGKTWHPGH